MRYLAVFASLIAATFAVAFAQESDGPEAPPTSDGVSEAAIVLDALAADEEDAAGPGDEELFARDSYQLRDIVCPFKGAIQYEPGEISCQLLEVPENREKKRARFIELHVVKIAAREPADWDAQEDGVWRRREDPVIYFTGGPGVKATTYVDRLKDHGVRDFRDLYILEQRGIGYSGDFCPIYALSDPEPFNTPDFAARAMSNVERAEICFAAAKAARVDLAGYNSFENARDAKALRRAFGFDQWNVWGISYGSILGQAYLKTDPEGVRAAVIDAIVPLEQGGHHLRTGRHFRRDLEMIAELCAADDSCAKNFPDLLPRYVAAVDAVRAEPIEIDAIDAELFPSGKAWFFHDLIGGAVFSSLYEQSNYPTLPAMMDGISEMVEKRDFARFRTFTSPFAGEGESILSFGMYNAIACNDGWFEDGPDVLREDLAENPSLAGLSMTPEAADAAAAICRKYGMKPRDAQEYAPVKTDIRTLIVNGAMDPITPPPLAEMILPGFTNGDYIEVDYAGHGPTRSVDCAGDFLTGFFDAPAGDLDTSCFADRDPPAFAGPLYKTDGVLRLAGLAAESDDNAAGPTVWFGLSAAALTLGALIYFFSGFARLLNRSGASSTGGARPLAFLTASVGAASALGLAAGAGATAAANEILMLAGLLGWTRWFVIAGFVGGLMGLWLLVAAVRAPGEERQPIGVMTGFFAVALAAIGLAAFYLKFGFTPL